MAKVMISMSDELLERVDSEARACGATRSATIRKYVEYGLGEPGRQLRDAMADLGQYARERPISGVDALRLGRMERLEQLGGPASRPRA